MPYIKIDVCVNNCMLYYKENNSKEKCDVCGSPRYEEGRNKIPRKVLRYLPIVIRLQRLYAHATTAKQLQCHMPSTSGKMMHPCDGEAWQQFDRDFPDFASDRRNVRLAFATDGFTPFSLNAASYLLMLASLGYSIESSTMHNHEIRVHIPCPCHPGS